MRLSPKAEAMRHEGLPGGGGLFMVKRGNATLRIIAADPGFCGWDHVSVSLATRCPTWDEMSYVRKHFFAPEETVVQFHVPEDQHVNNHPYCLHLWRKDGYEFPTPLSIFVGMKVAA